MKRSLYVGDLVRYDADTMYTFDTKLEQVRGFGLILETYDLTRDAVTGERFRHTSDITEDDDNHYEYLVVWFGSDKFKQLYGYTFSNKKEWCLANELKKAS